MSCELCVCVGVCVVCVVCVCVWCVMCCVVLYMTESISVVLCCVVLCCVFFSFFLYSVE